MSETDTARELLAPYCTGNGLDIGFGGHRPIVPHAICLDRSVGDGHRPVNDNTHPTHLVWDAFGRLPFENDTLNFIYSSHCLEDAVWTRDVLSEWTRVLRPGGRLVLFLPDQKAYLAHCEATGQSINHDHKHPDFSLDFVIKRLPANLHVMQSVWPFPGNPYSFAVAARKTG